MRTHLRGFILIATVAAVALLGAQLLLPGGDSAQASHGSTPGTVGILAVDTDVTNPDTIDGGAISGNNYHERFLLGECDGVIDDDGDTVVDDGCPGGPAPLNEVGDIDTCSDSMSVVGDTLDIDIIVDEVDLTDLMFGWSWNLNYDPTVIEIIGIDGLGGTNSGENRKMMIASLPDSGAAGGFIEIGADNPNQFVPDTDGQLVELISDFGTLPATQTHEFGEGVLTRITLRAVGTGISSLDLVGTALNSLGLFAPPAPGINLVTGGTTVSGGEVRVGQPCPQQTDVETTAVTTASPGVEQPIGAPFTVTADVGVSNLGGQDPVLVDTIIELNLPPDCSTTSTNPVTVQDTSVSVAASPVSLPQQSWSVTCTDPSFHDFTTTATAAIDPSELAFDTNSANDTRTSTASTTSLTADSDAAVSSVTVGVPVSAGTGSPFTVTGDVTASNISGADPVNVDTTIALTLPVDCSTGDINPVTVQDTSVSVAGSPVSVSQQSWSVTCTNASIHTFTVDATVAIDQMHVIDPTAANDSGSDQAQVPILVASDVETTAVTTTSPAANQPIGTPVIVTADVGVSNISGLDPVLVDTTIGLNLPTDCSTTSTNPVTVQDTSVSVAASPVSLPQQSWSVTCTDPSFHNFTTTATVAIDPGEPAFDVNANNDTQTSTASTTPFTGSADLSAQSVTVSGPASAFVGVSFNVNVDAVVANDASFSVNADVTVSLSQDPAVGPGTDCTFSPPAAQTATNVTVAASPATTNVPTQMWSVTCSQRSDHGFIADVIITENDAHVTDPSVLNDSSTSPTAGVPVFDQVDVEATNVTVAAPLTDQLAGTPFNVTADVTVSNLSGVDPVDVDTTITLILPSDCSTGSVNPVTVLNTLVSQIASPVSIPQQTWSVTCSLPSTHVFTVAAATSIVTLHVSDSNIVNDSNSSNDSVGILSTADLSVQSVTVTAPLTDQPASTPFNVTADVTVSNLSGVDPVDADTTITLTLPSDCSTGSVNPVTVLSTLVSQIASPVSLPQQSWSVTCTLPSAHVFAVNASTSIVTLHVSDSNNVNDTNSGNDSVGILSTADLAVQSVIVTSPLTDQPAGAPFNVTTDVTVSNLSGVDPVDADTTIALTLPSDCSTGSVNPVTVQNTTVSQAASPVSIPQQSWSVTCTQRSNHVFTVDASTIIATLHVSDPTNINDSGSGQATLAVTADADGGIVSATILNPPTSIAANTDVNVTLRKQLNNIGPVDPANFDLSKTAGAPAGCTITPPALSTHSLSSNSTTVDEIWTINCDATSASYNLTLDNTLTPTDLHVVDPNAANDSTSSPLTVIVDSDGDGIADAIDNCLTDVNASQLDTDSDGEGDVCDDDDDGDGVLDVNDIWCRLLAEDFDGNQDGDGCPDYDNDYDGICDAWFALVTLPLPVCSNPNLASPPYNPGYPGGAAPDRCINVSEDIDSYQDLDGCPEPDNDQDGFPDATDQCPGTDYTAGPDGIADSGDEPLDPLMTLTKEDYDGVMDTDGCHDSPGDDFDGDGLTDEDEVFIYFSNPANPDTDGDGIEDGVDGLNFRGGQATIASSNFTDLPGGTTYGSIVDSGGAYVTVVDVPDPDGVRITVSDLTGPATIDACGVTLTMPVGTETVVTCSSAHVNVLTGIVTVSLATIQASLPSQTIMTVVETAPDIFDVSNSPQSPRAISVGGITLAPGESATDVTDTDSDGTADSADNCPAVATTWIVPIGDDDCDGWSSPDETVIGTEPTLACGIAAWPPDMNDDQVVNLSDILFLAPPVFFSIGPNPPYDVRLDLNLDNVINLSDILHLAPPVFFATCTPLAP